MDFLLFVIILSILVFVHEAGHFIVAKRAGIRVLEFGFGLPPRIIGKKIGETIYSINMLPIGGFVRLFGEDSSEAEEDLRIYGMKGDAAIKNKLKKAFFTQSKRVRVAVVAAGVIMNLLLGLLIFSGLYTVVGIPTPVDEVQIIGIAPGSPAENTFQLGDVVESLDSQAVKTTQEFKDVIEKKSGQEVSFKVWRDSKSVDIRVKPRAEPPDDEGALGVVIAPKIEFKHHPIWQMPFRGVWFGMNEAYAWGMNIVLGLGAVLLQLFSGQIPKDVGGPFEIYYLVSEVAKVGYVPLLQLVGVLSINLAIINFLPIPALDGGRLLFIGLEALSGKRMSVKFERISHALGFALLLALMLAITLQDIMRRFHLESIRTLFQRVMNL